MSSLWFIAWKCERNFHISYTFNMKTFFLSVSGPRFWGLLNSAWSLCSSGKFQSPIDIKPDILLFDPSLKHLDIKIKKSEP
ncbi:hypothetical protein KUTeg_020440 [Tegillarca granosa]|uniref:Alpha-carbonic anhydrase domain-containing protein n=1 Tax=Tegillarca granosa TaxID=220873 RepID=A0ABQ9EDW7_TEGGR|nr:hypothetical protein KUTeg_020440 [Tegillarca granosa]